MAKFLTTTGLSYHLEQMIKTAKERLILISPYLQVNDRLRELLEDRDRLKLDVRVIYGKSELQPEQSQWLTGLRSVRTSFCKNLHAKCYLSESEAIVTSMNLYEFSQMHNNEMGIYVTAEADGPLFKEIYEEAQRLIRTSDEVQISVEKVVHKEAPAPVVVPAPTAVRTAPAKSARAAHAPHAGGFCIRCGDSIPLNRSRPYCATDYRKWAEYENEDYVDAFCHGCGEPHDATMRRPLCRDCYARVA